MDKIESMVDLLEKTDGQKNIEAETNLLFNGCELWEEHIMVALIYRKTAELLSEACTRTEPSEQIIDNALNRAANLIEGTRSANHTQETVDLLDKMLTMLRRGKANTDSNSRLDLAEAAALTLNEHAEVYISKAKRLR